MKCQKCGAVLKDNNQFCTECGHKQLPRLPILVNVGFVIVLLAYFSILLRPVLQYINIYELNLWLNYFVPEKMEVILLFAVVAYVSIISQKIVDFSVCPFFVICVLVVFREKLSYFPIIPIILQGVMLIAVRKLRGNLVVQLIVTAATFCLATIIEMLTNLRISGHLALNGNVADIFLPLILNLLMALPAVVLGDIIRRKLTSKYYL